jgi:hypothetical protein
MKKSLNQKPGDFCQMFVISVISKKDHNLGYEFKNVQKSVAYGFLSFVIPSQVFASPFFILHFWTVWHICGDFDNVCLLYLVFSYTLQQVNFTCRISSPSGWAAVQWPRW